MSISWDGVLGFIGALVGVLGAYFVVNYQLNKEHEQALETEKRVKQPRLVPGTANFDDVELYTGKDLVKGGKYLHELKRFSDVTIPIINVGTTPVFDISYFYEIENIEECASIFSEDNCPKDTIPRAYFESTEEKEYSFIYLYKYMKDGTEQKRKEYENTLKYNNTLSVIMPGETEHINLSKLVIMFLSYYLEMYDILYFINTDKEEFIPKIKVHIIYNDYEMMERKFEYNLVFGSKNSSNSILKYQLIPKDYKGNYSKNI
ncbi:hypothetical protein [Carnobacterium divergens]|uniref:hypothetical protein n=1 Tax=Carnobacterium divergens TaxID=2748 RepID=UPI0011026A97|nr:hypothetical protein CKN70_07055 [Carnobacterium divergens]TFI81254.1 hypothetical protein CKN68_07015 [Carnobacterium divergens]TFI90117.1 hypothetical protein CKN61_07420 [Carnobacterium divergens]